MGFHKRGDEESSVQEDSRGKTIFVRQMEIAIDRELEYRARVHMQFVCRMYKLQHEEGRYFLHEHCQSELPRRKDCVEEIQEMTVCQADVCQSR